MDFWKKGAQEELVLPRHIGIILDGNGRWATKRGLPRNMGHRRGAKAFREISKYCRKLGIPYLTVYAFSTENWSRPKEEVDAIMQLLRDYLKEVYDHQEENVRIHFLGDPAPLARDIRDMICEIEEQGAQHNEITVNIALNYGGRAELAKVARELVKLAREGKLSPDQVDEPLIERHLYTAGQPDPDMIIRPSGEMRTSNFLIWQAAYAEHIYMDVLWPDFTPAHLDRALEEYSRRDRRFGGI